MAGNPFAAIGEAELGTRRESDRMMNLDQEREQEQAIDELYLDWWKQVVACRSMARGTQRSIYNSPN